MSPDDEPKRSDGRLFVTELGIHVFGVLILLVVTALLGVVVLIALGSIGS